MFLCWLTSSRIAFQEILRKALQHAAGFVDQHFFGGVQTAGDGHFYGFAVGAVNHQSELAARDAFADDVVGFGAVQFKRFAVGAGQKLQRQHAHADQVGAVDALEAFGHDGFHTGQAHAFGGQSRLEPWP